jgi:aminoglycoside phosphotransferase (APT) family kinase protein
MRGAGGAALRFGRQSPQGARNRGVVGLAIWSRLRPMPEDTTTTVAAELIATQFPQWAHLPVAPVGLDGIDNTTFRLGDELSLRLPSAEAYVAQIEKEHRWLPILAPQLPLPIPVPLAVGRPGAGFPRPWSIYRWIDGDVASQDDTTDPSTLAADLAHFLNGLHAIGGTDGPRPGNHNFFRGGPISTYDAQTRGSIGGLAGQIDATAVTEVWDAALASDWDRAPVWVHGDVAPSNLIVGDRRLRAVIDFGCSAVGDPAGDVVMAWTYFSGESRSLFRRSLALDEATWVRGRGWALWKALITLTQEEHRGLDSAECARQFGWRWTAREVLDRVVADHAGST